MPAGAGGFQMLETRKRFHQELDALERDIPALAELAQEAVGKGVDALVRRDANLARQVIQEDDEIDRRYAEFAKEYADTAKGRTIAAWLKSKEPKREEPFKNAGVDCVTVGYKNTTEIDEAIERMNRVMNA